MANHPLKDWRLTRGWTQTQLGHRIGVTKGAVCKYEQGRPPEWGVMTKLVEVTAGTVTPNDWLPDQEAAQ
ncbi:helix-turn-helix domain-containing protein [Cohaesibacter celericrescens]|nr:helix-turn-helix transcriptional regulator [Cohaesibacter celericrescens]